MVKLTALKLKKAPTDFLEINDQLNMFEDMMKKVESEPNLGKRKFESSWDIYKVNHQKTLYVYNLYFKNKSMTKEVYDFIIKEGLVDKHLIMKWRKNGFEKLCCVLCSQNQSDFGGVCICRVPKSKLKEAKPVECIHCGCRGCASSD